MHELGIVFHIIKSVEEVGNANNVKRVSAVTLEIGEVSGIIDAYLTDCWKWAAGRSELLKDSELKIVKIPAVTHCEDCKEDYETVKYGKTCPHCQSENTFLLRGNEVNIKEIEVL